MLPWSTIPGVNIGSALLVGLWFLQPQTLAQIAAGGCDHWRAESALLGGFHLDHPGLYAPIFPMCCPYLDCV